MFTLFEFLNGCAYIKYSYLSAADCKSDLQFNNITDTMNISCHMFDSCLKIKCCVFVYEIETTFNVILDIQPCELTTFVSFENLKVAIPMSEVTTGLYIATLLVHTFKELNHLELL